MINKYTEGLEKTSDGRYKLRENLTMDKNSIVKKVITEKLTENVNGVDLPIYSKYLIKIWALHSMNKNGRNYKRVINQVVAEKKVTIGFMDHPVNSGDESYKNIVLIGKNPQIVNDGKEDWLCAEITLVGRPYGENCEAILEAGGFLEFSSSALGDVDSSTGEVLEDGFFLERYADIVVNSSNAQLFFKAKEEPRDISLKADDQLYDINQENINLTILNSTKEVLNEKTGDVSMPDKLSEKALELNIKSMIRDADTVADLVEKKNLLESALSYAVELTESPLVQSIQSKLDETTVSIHSLAEKGKSVDSLNESVTSLTEKISAIETELKTIKEEKFLLEENYNNIIDLYEKKQYESSETELNKSKELASKVADLTEELESVKNQLTKITEKKKYFEAMSNTKVDADDLVTLYEKVKKLTEQNTLLSERYDALRESVRNSRTKIQERPARQVKSAFASNDVEEFYNELVEQNEDNRFLRRELLNCKSLKEAKNIASLQESDPIEVSEDQDDFISKILASKGYN